MRGVWSVAAVRAAEEVLFAQLPEGALMRRAAYALSVHCGRLLARVYGGRVALLVGSGNNGGDALYAGAYLAGRGAAVTACLLSPDRTDAGGLAALRRAGGRAVDVTADEPAAERAVRAAAVVVDGVTGLSGSGPLRPAAQRLAAVAEDSAARRVAVDLPSGVDADTGDVPGAAFRAEHTVTFGATKLGLVVDPGAGYAGQVDLVDIGLGPHLGAPAAQLLEAADVAALWPIPARQDHKYSRGVVGVAAGSDGFPGAAVLAVGAAMRAKAGMVRYVGDPGPADRVRDHWPDVVVSGATPDPADGRVRAWVVGPGIGTGERGGELLRDALDSDRPVLVDADGLTLLADLLSADPEVVRRRSAPTVLTPHDGEFARLAGPVGTDRVGAATRAAADIGATVLLKGGATIVADPDGSVLINPTGTPWLATAGTGDVLSGVSGALLAAGVAPTLAAAAAAYLHGVAGRVAGGDLATGAPPAASDVLAAIPAALRLVRGGSS